MTWCMERHSHRSEKKKEKSFVSCNREKTEHWHRIRERKGKKKKENKHHQFHIPIWNMHIRSNASKNIKQNASIQHCWWQCGGMNNLNTHTNIHVDIIFHGFCNAHTHTHTQSLFFWIYNHRSVVSIQFSHLLRRLTPNTHNTRGSFTSVKSFAICDYLPLVGREREKREKRNNLLLHQTNDYNAIISMTCFFILFFFSLFSHSVWSTRIKFSLRSMVTFYAQCVCVCRNKVSATVSVLIFQRIFFSELFLPLQSNSNVSL